jgi:hypothetical protein
MLCVLLPPGWEPVDKAYVRSHTRTLPSGRTVHVPAYFTRRVAHPKEGAKERAPHALKQAPARGVHPGQTHEQLAHRLVRHVHEGTMSHAEAEANLAHLERRAHAGHHLEHGTGRAWTPEETHQFIAHARGRLAEHREGQARAAQETQRAQQEAEQQAAWQRTLAEAQREAQERQAYWRAAEKQRRQDMRDMRQYHDIAPVQPPGQARQAQEAQARRIEELTGKEAQPQGRYHVQREAADRAKPFRVHDTTTGRPVVHPTYGHPLRFDTEADAREWADREHARLATQQAQTQERAAHPGQGPPRGITQRERQEDWDARMRQRQQEERERQGRESAPPRRPRGQRHRAQVQAVLQQRRAVGKSLVFGLVARHV